ncbi:MAG: hypothetical protein DRJ28_02095 [Actinobacteria bacterium]|nr:MAG: hypothetical protein DRJ28_02095 [Actinomycetota bacterium]
MTVLAWGNLTEAGQIRRLRSLAVEALKEYPIDALRLRLVDGFTNVIFRVDTGEGPFALRVDLHQEHSDTDVDIEFDWLASLARDSDVDVVRSVPASDGRGYVHAAGSGVPGSVSSIPTRRGTR